MSKAKSEMVYSPDLGEGQPRPLRDVVGALSRASAIANVVVVVVVEALVPLCGLGKGGYLSRLI